jgi:hypothetical protein
MHVYLNAIDGYARSLIRFGADTRYAAGVSPVELRYFIKLRDEFLRVRDRLDALHTGLRAERELSQSLTAAAAAANEWHRGMATTDGATIDRARTRVQHHFRRAGQLGAAGLADLEKGR